MKTKQTFESAMERLEDIVAGLEGGNLPLEESLAAFEEAVGLVRFCNETLEKAKQKVRILTEGDDGVVSDRPFVPEEDDET